MSGLLFVLGGIAVVAGVAMIGFGIPINEFSFGNTLIGAGTTSAVGGLILFGLAVGVSKLQQIVDALAVRPVVRSGRAAEPAEAALPNMPRAPGSARIPFPLKAKPDGATSNGRPAEQRPVFGPALGQMADERPAQFDAPMLSNPDEGFENSFEAPLSPRQSPFVPTKRHPERVATQTNGRFPAPPNQHDEMNSFEELSAPAPDTAWQPAPPPISRPMQNGNLDTRWQPEPRAEAPMRVEAPMRSEAPMRAEKPASESIPKAPPQPNFAPAPTFESRPAKAPEPSLAARPAAAETHAVAVLKTGVVDGMGYTLYVDGSIEAELPQGILRFGSIADLRSHLEKNS